MNYIKTWYVLTISKLFWLCTLPLSIRDFFMWPIATRVLRYSYTAVTSLASGLRVHAYMSDQIGRLVIFYGKRFPYFWEPGTTQLVEKLSHDAQEVLIAGSHIGLMVLHARKAMASPTGRVHTFEPIPSLYEIAKKNFALNDQLGTIMIERSALGDTPGTVTMTDDRLRSKIIDPNAPTRHQTEQVSVTTIDDYALKNEITYFDFVLLDVEGYEFHALSGMKKLLSKKPPRDIIYEIIKPTKNDFASVHNIEALLKPLGYSFYIIEDVCDPLFMNKRNLIPSITLIPASEASYTSHKNERYFNVYATKRSRDEVHRIANLVIQK